jgi:hypothetical protein
MKAAATGAIFMITVLFSCDRCGLKDAECIVRARAEDDDVVHYVRDVVMHAVAKRHATLSLLCDATSIQNLKIPVDTKDPDGWIGKQTDMVPPKSNS